MILPKASAELTELTSFASVRLGLDAIHGDGERRVRLVRNRAERHCASGKTPHNFSRTFHLQNTKVKIGAPSRHLYTNEQLTNTVNS